MPTPFLRFVDGRQCNTGNPPCVSKRAFVFRTRRILSTMAATTAIALSAAPHAAAAQSPTAPPPQPPVELATQTPAFQTINPSALPAPQPPAGSESHSPEDSSKHLFAAVQNEFQGRAAVLDEARKALRTALETMNRFDESLGAARRRHAAALATTGVARTQALQALDDAAVALTAASREAFVAEERALRSMETLESHATRLHFRTSEWSNTLASGGATPPEVARLSRQLLEETHTNATRTAQAVSGMKDILNAALAGSAALGPLGERTAAQAARLRATPGASQQGASASASRAFAQSLAAATTRLTRLRESLASLPARLAADVPPSAPGAVPLAALKQALRPTHP